MSTANDRQWMERYHRLIAFQTENNGHCCVPNTYKQDPQLAKWVKKQRYNQIAGKLRNDRKQLLQKIGFAWSGGSNNATFDQQWMEVYNLLVAFQKQHGHTRVTVTGVHENEKHLAVWVMNQRALQRSGELRKDRKELLDKIGFIWRTGDSTQLAPLAVFDQRWMDRYKDLVAFRNEKGHCRVPFTYPEDPQLAIWVLNQRKFQRAGQLRKDRYDLLDDIEFVWRTGQSATTSSEDDMSNKEEESLWMSQFRLLCDFKEQNGHTNVPQSGKHRDLGQWIRVQQDLLQRGELSDDKQELLEGLMQEATKSGQESNSTTSNEMRDSSKAETLKKRLPETVTSLENGAPVQQFAIGTRIKKPFELEKGSIQLFRGTVTAFEEFDESDGIRVWGYLIHYEDGDQEHMLEEELANFVIRNKKKRTRAEKSQTNSPKRYKEPTMSPETVRSLEDDEMIPVAQKFATGTRIVKILELDQGATQMIGGEVIAFEEFSNENGARLWGYLIRYENGDQEHMREDEVAKYEFAVTDKWRGERLGNADANTEKPMFLVEV